MRTVLIMLGLLIAGCSSLQQTSPKASEDTQWSPSRYYNEARQAHTSGDYPKAIKYLADLEITYPFTPYAQLAPLEMAYARFKMNEFDQAVSEANRFIEYYPNHPNTDYALYLKGLARSSQGNISLPADTATNQINTQTQYKREAYQYFAKLVKNYPDSRYHEQAQQRLKELRVTLAQYELIQVEEHLAAGETSTALERAKYIADNYPGTAAANEATSLLQQYAVFGGAPETGDVPPKAIVLSDVNTNKNVPSQKTPYREDWLLAQNPQHYTIQITATSNKYWLDTFIKQNRLQNDIAYFKRARQGKDWYAVLYGHYDDYAEASAAAENLHSSLKIKDTWIRQYKDIQKSIQENDPAP